MSVVLDPIPTDAASAAFAEAVARAEAGQECIILTRAGKPVAALVPIADLETSYIVIARSLLPQAEQASPHP